MTAHLVCANRFSAEKDDDFLLDVSESMPVDSEVLIPLDQGREAEVVDEMAIDEEGRPRFAPSKDIVRLGS
jgi:RNA-binding protein PNO1